MIRYTLKCANGHSFKSWFRSADAYERVRAAGMVACAECGSTEVDKTIMAPNVRPGRKAEARRSRAPADPQAGREAMLARIRAEVEANSEYVGMNFASEARATHEGDAPGRSIYGEARPRDAKSLIEDGIPVAPLPFTPTRKTN